MSKHFPLFLSLVTGLVILFSFPTFASAATVIDSFTDTANTLLENHTSDSGNIWAKNSGYVTSNLVVTSANRIRSAANSSIYDSNWTPASADYIVSADIYVASVIIGAQVGVGGRAGTTAYTGYYALLVQGSPNKILLYNGASSIGAHDVTINPGETHTVRLSMVGSNIQVYWDGSSVINVTNTSITTAGTAAAYIAKVGTDSTGFHLDNFSTAGVPLSPGTLSASSGSTAATLSWTASSGGQSPITSQLQRSLSGDNSWSDVAGATTSPVTDTGLTPSTAYDYRVIYTDVAASVAYSSTITVTTANITDTFTDTATTLLENHTSDSGHTWARNGVVGRSIMITDANRLRANSADVFYNPNWVPASADYSVSANIYIASIVNGSLTGIGGRAGTTAFTGYYALLTGGAQPTIRLYRSSNVFGTHDVTINPGETHTVRLSMVGSNIQVYWDGSSVISITDDSITTAGTAAIYMGTVSTNSTGFHLDNFTAGGSGTILSPGALSTTSYGSTAATLSWTASSGGQSPITSQLQRSLSGDNSWSDVAGATTSPVTDTGLTPSTAYDYRVIYTDVAASVAYSSTITVTTNLNTTTYIAQQSDFWDNGYDNINVPRQSTFARLVFTTDATSIAVKGTTDGWFYATYPEYAHLGLRINGVNQPSLIFTTGGSQTFTVDLGSAGTTRTIELITGSQSVAKGSFIDNVTYPEASTFTMVSPNDTANRVVVYGDSIAAGGNATNPESEAYVTLLRNVYGQNVMLEAWGSRTLYDDTNTSGLLNAFVGRISSYVPSTIWLAIGTNDYYLNKWSASDFGTAYAALVDGLHTALPSAHIICQTPIVRGGPATNSFGNTIIDFRTQISTICAARSWATLVDGTTFLAFSDLGDVWVHPSTVGHAKYADRIAPILAQPSYVISGPSSGPVSQNSTAFTVTLGNTATFLGDQAITISDGGNGGVFTPSVGSPSISSVTITPAVSSASFTFTYTPVSTGTKILTFTNSQSGWSNPNNITYFALSDSFPSVSHFRGNSVQNQIENLLAMGNTKLADELKAKYITPDLATTSLATPKPLAKAGQMFTRDLKLGTKHAEVKLLQQFLNTHGFLIDTKGQGSPGQETTLFGKLTQQALIKFQKANKIKPASGYFGPITRKVILKLT